jgi:hypothetical protein
MFLKHSCGTPKKFLKGNEKVIKMQTEDYWLGR